MTLHMQGAGLLDVPQEILWAIASHFDVDEWARGPSMTCHRLYNMSLTKLAILKGAVYYKDCEANQRIASRLAWAAKRTTAATTSLKVSFHVDEASARTAASNPLVAALSGIAQLSNLRSLVFLVHPLEEDGADHVTVGCLNWLLEQATRVEAVFLRTRTIHLPSSHITFQHMRHLIMPSHGFQSRFRVAEQLPALETLSICHSSDTGLEVMDMSGCTRLRQLVLYNFVAQQLIWDAASLGPCPLTFELQSSYQRFEKDCPSSLQKQAAMAQQVVLYYLNGREGLVQGMLSAFPQMQVLALRWPKGYKSECFDEYEFRTLVGGLLTWCMPADGQPLLHLKIIIITACSMHFTFPRASQLPSLRELVINASGCLELSLQDPVDTITRLSSLHVLGRPLGPPGWDLMKLMAASGALEERGLVPGAAATEQHGLDKRPASCMYLHPVGTRELSIEELCTTVEQLAQCRCGACLICWRRAGYIDA